MHAARACPITALIAQVEDFVGRGRNLRKHRENPMIRVYVKSAR
jgi:hypothetical protein